MLAVAHNGDEGEQERVSRQLLASSGPVALAMAACDGDSVQDKAARPNVFSKVPGLNSAADPEAWDGECPYPDINYATEFFAARWVVFDRGWPVARRPEGYQRASIPRWSHCPASRRMDAEGYWAVRPHASTVSTRWRTHD